MMRGRSLAKMKARKLLSQLGIKAEAVNPNKKKNLAVNIDDVAKLLKLKIIPHAFSEDVSGVFFRKGSELIIGVNEHHHEHRRRFTVAHEIGHYLLHSSETLHYDTKAQLDEIYFRADSISNSDEIEANHFAAELLMPEDIVHKCIQSGIQSIPDLAERFNVSEYAMRYRLTNLGFL